MENEVTVTDHCTDDFGHSVWFVFDEGIELL